MLIISLGLAVFAIEEAMIGVVFPFIRRDMHVIKERGMKRAVEMKKLERELKEMREKFFAMNEQAQRLVEHTFQINEVVQKWLSANELLSP